MGARSKNVKGLHDLSATLLARDRKTINEIVMAYRQHEPKLRLLFAKWDGGDKRF
jgi:hypothetical protein